MKIRQNSSEMTIFSVLDFLFSVGFGGKCNFWYDLGYFLPMLWC